MRGRLPIRASALPAWLLCVACASPVANPGDRGPLDATPPPDRIPGIDLTVWAIQGAATEAGTQLDDAKVCVPLARRRSNHPKWTDFLRPPHVQCSSQVIQSNAPGVLLHGVPADSELIVTAEGTGYRPSAFSVTTGLGAEDFTRATSLGGGSDMALAPAANPWGNSLPPDLHPDPKLGDIEITVTACVELVGPCAWLGGASVTLAHYGEDGLRTTDVPAGSGPYYSGPNGYAPGLAETPPNGRTTFVDLPEGDYLVRVSHPRATCRVNGYALGNPDEGYASDLNEARLAILAGHSTLNVGFYCFCNDELLPDGATNFTLDPSTCLPPVRDAGPD